jgi:hypothetical protein
VRMESLQVAKVQTCQLAQRLPYPAMAPEPERGRSLLAGQFSSLFSFLSSLSPSRR